MKHVSIALGIVVLAVAAFLSATEFVAAWEGQYPLSGETYNGWIDGVETPEITATWTLSGSLVSNVPLSITERYVLSPRIITGTYHLLGESCTLFLDEETHGNAWNNPSQVIQGSELGTTFEVSPTETASAWAAIECKGGQPFQIHSGTAPEPPEPKTYTVSLPLVMNRYTPPYALAGLVYTATVAGEPNPAYIAQWSEAGVLTHTTPSNSAVHSFSIAITGGSYELKALAGGGCVLYLDEDRSGEAWVAPTQKIEWEGDFTVTPAFGDNIAWAAIGCPANSKFEIQRR